MKSSATARGASELSPPDERRGGHGVPLLLDCLAVTPLPLLRVVPPCLSAKDRGAFAVLLVAAGREDAHTWWIEAKDDIDVCMVKRGGVWRARDTKLGARGSEHSVLEGQLLNFLHFFTFSEVEIFSARARDIQGRVQNCQRTLLRSI